MIRDGYYLQEVYYPNTKHQPPYAIRRWLLKRLLSDRVFGKIDAEDWSSVNEEFWLMVLHGVKEAAGWDGLPVDTWDGLPEPKRMKSAKFSEDDLDWIYASFRDAHLLEES